jgi:hypothetical protein
MLFPRVHFLPMKQFSLLMTALVAVFASFNGTSAGATGAMDTPHTDAKPLNESTTNLSVKPHVIQQHANGNVQAAYFSNWYVTVSS